MNAPLPAETAVPVDDALLAAWPLPEPSPDGDKEERGRILLVGGSSQMPGAIMLAAIAALRAGAGKLTVATSHTVASMVAAHLPEARVIALDETRRGQLAPGELQRCIEPLAAKVDALVIGPGCESGGALLDDIAAILPAFRQAAVLLDAGAMEVVTHRVPRGAEEGDTDARWPTVLLTPHAGEMAHLTGLSKESIQADPAAILQRASRQWNAVIALKGACTRLRHPDGRCWLHRGGNSGLGTSGSGDTLAGIIGGLAARGASLEQAAVWGVALHARAGEALAEKFGPLGYLARELSAEVPRLMQAAQGAATRPR